MFAFIKSSQPNIECPLIMKTAQSFCMLLYVFGETLVIGKRNYIPSLYRYIPLISLTGIKLYCLCIVRIYNYVCLYIYICIYICIYHTCFYPIHSPYIFEYTHKHIHIISIMYFFPSEQCPFRTGTQSFVVSVAFTNVELYYPVIKHGHGEFHI